MDDNIIDNQGGAEGTQPAPEPPVDRVNAAEATKAPGEPPVEVTDEYMDTFERVAHLTERVAVAAAAVDNQPHDQARVARLVAAVREQNTLNREVYKLLVTMSDFFMRAR